VLADGRVRLEIAAQLDLFDVLQLQAVIKVCQSNSMSDAGRTLDAVSRAAKANPNDADRLKKFLASVARHRRHRGQTPGPGKYPDEKKPDHC
jgi:sigma54-dependent transcription regulator